MIVKIKSGSLRIAVENGIHVARGIPFAQPPVGDLRFRAPAACKPWRGVRDALQFANSPIQQAQPGLVCDEDCLYLNIYAPSTKGPHPVFVWIFGGGFIQGRSSDPVYDGTSFAMDGVVVVTIAYRLGSFGFLDVESLLGSDYRDSANNGIRDQICALQWVQSNIEAFGGDPSRMTIGGESAGAKSVATLLAIPEATATFQSAISESGGGVTVFDVAEAAHMASLFSEHWQQSGHPIDQLKAASATTVLNAQQAFLKDAAFGFQFRPETGHDLLRSRPVDRITQGSASRIRLLLGTNLDESALFLGASPKIPVTESKLANTTLSRFNAVLDRYGEIYPDLTSPQREIRALTAEEYWVPSINVANAQASNNADVWMYRFDYRLGSGDLGTQAYHSEELRFVWDTLSPAESAVLETTGLARCMHSAWTAFIKGGIPTAQGLPAWPRYLTSTRPTMILDRVSRVETSPNADELALWSWLR